MGYRIEKTGRLCTWTAVAAFLMLPSAQASDFAVARLSPRHLKMLAKCEEIHEAGKLAVAYRGILILRRQLGKSNRHPCVEARAAEILIDLNKPMQASVLVAPYLVDRGNYRRLFAETYLAGARAALAQNRFREAIGLYDWIASEENHGDISIQSQAAMGVGRVLAKQNQLPESLNAFKFALNNIAAERAKIRKESEGAELNEGLLLLESELKALAFKTRLIISKRKRQADDEAFKRQVGEAFLLYRAAEKHRRGDKKYDIARQKYALLVKKYPNTVYAKAARLYGPLCLLEKGGLVNAKRAERELISFIDEGASEELYKGEALLWVSRIAIEYRRDPKQASKELKRLDIWIASVRKRIIEGEDRIDGYKGVRNGAAKLSMPPQIQYSKNLWGNTKASKIQFGQLLNRKTSKWYLDDLEARCAMCRGFLYFANAESDLAKIQFDRILNLDPRQSKGAVAWNPNNFTRLQFGTQHGRWIAFPKELKLYSKSQQFLILLADFFYVTERFDRALKIHFDFEAGRYGKMAPGQLDYVWYMQASCIYMMPAKIRSTSMIKSINTLEKILARRDKTWTEPRAAFKLYQISRFLTVKKIVARGDQLLRQLAYQDQHNPYAHEARLLLALDLIEKDRFLEVKKLLLEIPERDSEYRKQADSYLEALDNPDSPLWKFIQKPHPSRREHNKAG